MSVSAMLSTSAGKTHRPTRRGAKSIANRKTTTSTEVKQRWEAKTYKKYLVRLRPDTDAELIAYLEERKDTIGTTQIFREALQDYLNRL